VLGGIAAVLHVGIAVFPLSASGLLAPLWAILVVYSVWLAAAVSGYRSWRRRPWTALLAPAGTLAFWVALLGLGDWALGWTA
jgi:hypothetical protein